MVVPVLIGKSNTRLKLVPMARPSDEASPTGVRTDDVLNSNVEHTDTRPDAILSKYGIRLRKSLDAPEPDELQRTTEPDTRFHRTPKRLELCSFRPDQD